MADGRRRLRVAVSVNVSPQTTYYGAMPIKVLRQCASMLVQIRPWPLTTQWLGRPTAGQAFSISREALKAEA